jgi:Flp pilus assembly protein TadD
MPSPLLPALRRAALALLAFSAMPAHSDAAAEVRELIGRGDLAAALQRAEKAVVADPGDAQLRFLRGVVLMDLHRDTEALALYIEMTQRYPELADPYNNIALLQVRAGHLEQARQALLAALRSDPRHRIARINLGQVELMLALEAWEEAASQGPVDPPLQHRMEAVRALLAEGDRSAR